MLCFVVAAMSFAAPAEASDYFPLKPGFTWEYQISLDGPALKTRQMQKILSPVQIAGESASPMQVWLDGKLDSTSYYQAKDGFVYLVAVTDKERLARPVPVLPIEPKKGQKWEFEGSMQILGAPAPSIVRSKIAGFEETDVLGKKLKAVRVESDAQMGSGQSAMIIRTTEIYAAGVGLVYKKQQMKAERGGTATLNLVNFEEGRR